MTTAILAAPVASTASRRITRVVRLHLTNPWTTIVLPWAILGAILVLNLAIWALIRASLSPHDLAHANDGLQYSGASAWIFFYMAVVAIQAMNLTFPLALGYGSTRRDFSLGTALTFVLLSAMYAVGLTLLSVIETVTGGWGLGGSMFSAIYFGGDSAAWFVKLAIYFFGMLFFFFVGSLFGSVFVRWRATGIIGLWILIAAVLVGAATLLTLTRQWIAVGNFFTDAGAFGTASALLAPAAIAAVASALVLRRATPRS